MKAIRLKALGLFGGLILSLNFVQAQYLEIIPVDNTVPTAATQTAGAWYVDRYPPAAFEMFDFAGENVIRHAIDGINDGSANRPGGQGGTFYNTHGRKYDLGPGALRIYADIYIPSSFETNHRRAGLWATAVDASDVITAFPILSFRNVDGMSPTFSYFSSALADWVNLGVTITYDTWYSLEIVFDVIDQEFEYYLNGALVGTDAASFNNSSYARNMILQVYNFNDPALPAEQQSTDSYEVYWDNVGSLTESPPVVATEPLPSMNATKKAALMLVILGFALVFGYRRMA